MKGIDATTYGHITARGELIQAQIKTQMHRLLHVRDTVRERLENEITNKEQAVAMFVNSYRRTFNGSVDPKYAFIMAYVKQLADLEDELDELRTVIGTFDKSAVYALTQEQLRRFNF